MIEINALLKRIINLQTLGFLVALCSLLVAIEQNWLSLGGDISVSINNQKVGTEYSITSYVYYNNQEFDNISSILPNIENDTRFTVNDLNVRYNIISENMTFTTSPNFDISGAKGNVQLKNTERSLYAFETLESPISSITLNNANSSCQIAVKITYNGIEEPINIRQNLYFKNISASENTEDVAFTDFGKNYSSRNNFSLYILNNGSLKNYDVKDVLAYNEQKQNAHTESSKIAQNNSYSANKKESVTTKSENILSQTNIEKDENSTTTKVKSEDVITLEPTNQQKAKKGETGWLDVIIILVIVFIAFIVLLILVITLLQPTMMIFDDYLWEKCVLKLSLPTWQGIKDAYEDGVYNGKNEIRDMFNTSPGDWINGVFLITNIISIIIAIPFILVTVAAMCFGLFLFIYGIISIFK